MARKEMIYTVEKETNTIIRVSKSYLAAIEFASTLKEGTVYTCTSVFNYKKGDTITDVQELL
jgi:hypothetical protein